MRVFSTNDIVDTQYFFAETLHNSILDASMQTVDAKYWANSRESYEWLREWPRTITSFCHHAATVIIMSDPPSTGDNSVLICAYDLSPPPHHW